MKKCAYCGRENDDDAANCRERGTDEFKKAPAATVPENIKQNNPAVTPSEATMELGEDDLFPKLGDFDPFDAEKILKRFEEAGVRFQINAPNEIVPGSRSFARISYIEIYTHRDDGEKVSKVMNEFCKV
jgi:hypothetical protein